MVSCGFRANAFNYDEVDGARMSNDGTTCTAQNGDGGTGVYAEARYVHLVHTICQQRPTYNKNPYISIDVVSSIKMA